MFASLQAAGVKWRATYHSLVLDTQRAPHAVDVSAAGTCHFLSDDFERRKISLKFMTCNSPAGIALICAYVGIPHVRHHQAQCALQQRFHTLLAAEHSVH